MLRAHRDFRSVTDRRQSIGGNTESDQVILGCLRTLSAERQVIICCTSLVAVSFDLHTQHWIALKPLRIRFKGRTAFFREIVAVETEVNVLDWTGRKRRGALTPL